MGKIKREVEKMRRAEVRGLIWDLRRQRADHFRVWRVWKVRKVWRKDGGVGGRGSGVGEGKRRWGVEILLTFWAGRGREGWCVCRIAENRTRMGRMRRVCTDKKNKKNKKKKKMNHWGTETQRKINNRDGRKRIGSADYADWRRFEIRFKNKLLAWRGLLFVLVMALKNKCF
jgi:hypothetical protein